MVGKSRVRIGTFNGDRKHIALFKRIADRGNIYWITAQCTCILQVQSLEVADDL